MSARPLAHFLTDFSRPSAALAAAAVPAGPTQEEIDAQIDEARAQGFEAGRDAAMAEMAAEMEQARAQAAAALDTALTDAREAWTAEQADRLAELVGARILEIETDVARLVAQCLRGVVADAISAPAVVELAEALRTHLTDERHAVLKVAGPRDLIDALRGRLSSSVCSMDCVEADQVDVVVTLGDTQLETRLGAWRAGLDSAIAGASGHG